MNQQYDYIIAGAGASGLSLAWRMLHSPLSDQKRILIVDADLTPKNDKTWCFWHAGTPPYSELIHKKWSKIEIGTPDGRSAQQLQKYSYFGLRSIEFTQQVLQTIQDHPNFDLLESTITHLTALSSKQAALLHTEDNIFKASYIFQSCFEPPELQEADIRYPLKQHFLGWELASNKPVFDASACTLMDFDDTFAEGVSFIYLLPWDNTSGLIEYTIFSDQLAKREVYEEKMALYLHNRFNLRPIDYQISRRERGVIPMQDRPFIPWYKPRILNIGTRGGLTKPSTGYIFMRIQDQTQAIVDGLVADEAPHITSPSAFRFKAYDLWLLHILYNHPQEALEIFYHLFKNNTIDEVFRFLNEGSTPFEDLKIMSSVPYRPFLRAIWQSRKRLQEIR